MLQIKNTLCCPGCAGILRVSAQVVSDGKLYQYYLCPKCSDVVREDPATKAWRLQGADGARIPEVVQFLAALAVEDWRSKSSERQEVLQTKAVSLPQAKSGPPSGMGVVTRQASAGLTAKERPAVRSQVVAAEGLGKVPEKDRPQVRVEVVKGES